MPRFIDCIRLAILSFCLIIFPVAAASCSAPPRTPEQQQRIDETQGELDATQSRLAQLAAELEGLEPGTPEHLAVSQQIVAEAQRGATLEQDLIDQDTETATGFVGGILDLVGMFVPGSGAFKPAVLSLAPLAFERPRKHFLNALQQVNPLNGQMAPAEAARSILAAVGLLHSSANSAEIAKVDMAHPKGVRATENPVSPPSAAA